MSGGEPTRVLLGLGSNIGDRHAALDEAVAHLDQLPATTVVRVSSIFETEPWGEKDQEPFLNAAAEIHTLFAPAELLAALKDIERSMGRERTRKNGPRRIDIDILLFGEDVVQVDGLTIPHPGLAQRQFVLAPLREIAGEAIHPVSGLTVDEMAARCTDTGTVVKTTFRLQCC